MIHKIINPTKITHYTVDKFTGDIELHYSYNEAQAIICCINELGSVVNNGHIASVVVTLPLQLPLQCSQLLIMLAFHAIYSIYKTGIYLRKRKKVSAAIIREHSTMALKCLLNTVHCLCCSTSHRIVSSTSSVSCCGSELCGLPHYSSRHRTCGHPL